MENYENEEYKIKYPLEIKSVISKSGKGENEKVRTLSVEQHLFPASEKPRKNTLKEELGIIQDPLKLFAEYSVFRLTIVEKKGESKKSVYANIPVTELAKMVKRTDICTKYIVEAEMKSSEQTEDNAEKHDISPAYTQKLAVGCFKYKTPAQVLIENPSNLDKLKNTENWLKERLDMHENNRKQYEAIHEAIELFNAGKLSKTVDKSVSVQKAVKVYDADIRPLESTKRNDGKIMVYAVHIRCYPENNYPFEIEIENYWTKWTANGPEPESIEDKRKHSIYISESDWDDAVEQMKIIKDIYIRCWGRYELERALRANEYNRGKAK